MSLITRDTRGGVATTSSRRPGGGLRLAASPTQQCRSLPEAPFHPLSDSDSTCCAFQVADAHGPGVWRPLVCQHASGAAACNEATSQVTAPSLALARCVGDSCGRPSLSDSERDVTGMIGSVVKGRGKGRGARHSRPTPVRHQRLRDGGLQGLTSGAEGARPAA
jgi:hypothetical protein